MITVDEALDTLHNHLIAIKFELKDSGRYTLTEGWITEGIVRDLESAVQCLEKEVKSDLSP
jgi:hypothetical protein